MNFKRQYSFCIIHLLCLFLCMAPSQLLKNNFVYAEDLNSSFNLADNPISEEDQSNISISALRDKVSNITVDDTLNEWTSLRVESKQAVYAFIPEESGYFRVYTVPYFDDDDIGNEFDTDIMIYDNEGYVLYDNVNEFSDTYDYFIGGHTYYIDFQNPNYQQDGPVWLYIEGVGFSESPKKILLNTPTDVQIWAYSYPFTYPHNFEVFNFTPEVSGEYNIFTGSSTNLSPEEPIVLDVFSGAYLDNLIVSSRQPPYPQVRAYLTAGNTYSVLIRSSMLYYPVSCTLIVEPLTSKDTQPPTDPSNLKVEKVANDTYILTWTASSDNVGVHAYNIYNGTMLIGRSTTTNFTTQIEANTLYSINVRAEDFSKNISGASNTVSMYIDRQAPTAPNNLTAVGRTEKNVTLTWGTSSDNVGVVGYDIYNGVTYIGSSMIPSYTAPITNNALFSFAVKARDAEGNISAPSNAVIIHDFKNASYSYDNLGRLDYITLPNGLNIDYQYDANGNLLRIVYP